MNKDLKLKQGKKNMNKDLKLKKEKDYMVK